MDLPPCIDRLSALPDDILLAILEKLGGSARDAVRTCVLSRRWADLPWLLPEPRNLWLGSADVAAVLAACPRLEHLELCQCCCRKSSDVGNGMEELVVADAPALRALVLDACFYRLVALRNAPRLTRLKCDMWAASRAPVSLRGAPCLETLELANPAKLESKGFKLSELLANTTGLRCLSLNFRSQKIWVQPDPPRTLSAVFSKLTSLALGGVFAQCDLLWMMALLEAAQFLREFRIMVQKHLCLGEDFDKEERTSMWKQSDSSHSHLENLHITGFEVEEKYMTFVRLIMERATNLKTIILADEEPCELCDPVDDSISSVKESRYPKNDDEKSSTVKQLKDELSSSVQIIIS